MKAHGTRLDEHRQANHLSIRELAERLGVSRIAVEKHLRSETLTRKVLSRYVQPLGLDVEKFYAECEEKIEAVESQSQPESAAYWKGKYYDLLERYNVEMEEQAKLVRSVFTKAAPMQQIMA